LSPHNGGPLTSYENGVSKYLTSLTEVNPTLWTEAQAGNPAALQFFSDEVSRFDNIMTAAFCNGAVFTNTPANLPGTTVDEINNAFFGDVSEFAANNEALINSVANARAALPGSASEFITLRNADQVEEALAYSRANGLNLTRDLLSDPTITNSGSPTSIAALQQYLDAVGFQLPYTPDSADLAKALQAEEATLGETDAASGLGGKLLGTVNVILTAHDALSSYANARAKGFNRYLLPLLAVYLSMKLVMELLTDA
jgi:hypothetical protein